MPAFVLIFSSRSFASYLVMLALPAVVADCSVQRAVERTPCARAVLWGSLRRRIAVLGVARARRGRRCWWRCCWPPPLRLSITAVFGSRRTIRDQPRRDSGHATAAAQTVHPVFAAKAGGEITAPWLVISGPPTLGPGQAGAVPDPGTQLLGPATRGRGVPDGRAHDLAGGDEHVAAVRCRRCRSSTIDPVFVNSPVPPGRPITFTVRVVDHYGRPVLGAPGRPYILHQTSYTRPVRVRARSRV